jgi:manganese transport protein
VILSLQLGFAIIPLIHFVSDKEKMGKFVMVPGQRLLRGRCSHHRGIKCKTVFNEVTALIQDAGDYRWIVYITVLPVIAAHHCYMLYVTFKTIVHPEKVQTAWIAYRASSIDFVVKDQFRRIAIIG